MNQPSPKVVGCGGPDTLPVVADRARADVRRAGGATLCTSSVLIWPQTSYGQRGKDWEQTPLERPIGPASDQSAPPSRSGDRLRCSLLCAGQPAATQSLVRPLPRSNGIYCIGPVIRGRARTSLMRVPAKAGPTSAGPPLWPHRLWRRRHPALAWIRNCPRRRSLRCRS